MPRKPGKPTEGSRAVAGRETRTHDVVINNHNFRESWRSRKTSIRSRDEVSRGVAATFLFRGSQGKKK